MEMCGSTFFGHDSSTSCPSLNKTRPTTFSRPSFFQSRQPLGDSRADIRSTHSFLSFFVPGLKIFPGQYNLLVDNQLCHFSWRLNCGRQGRVRPLDYCSSCTAPPKSISFNKVHYSDAIFRIDCVKLARQSYFEKTLNM